MTIDQIGPAMVGLVPELATFVPPARVFDKHVYSPWTGSELHQQLRSTGIDTVIITGGETDVCVLSTMLGAIDWGFRVILVTDALCSSADETHDAMMNIYMNRFGLQEFAGQLARRYAGKQGLMSERPRHTSYKSSCRRKRATGNLSPQSWFEDLLEELTGEFGGLTSFIRAPGRGL